MQVVVKNTYHCDIIECPDFLVPNLVKLQTEYDKPAVMNDWIVSLETFTQWINRTYLKDNDEKVRIISTCLDTTEELNKLPRIYY